MRAVAARHGICESLVFTWRRQVNDGLLTMPALPVFLPVQVFEPPMSAELPRSEQPLSPASAPTPPRPQAGLIEIELGGGRQVRVGSDVNLTALELQLEELEAGAAEEAAALGSDAGNDAGPEWRRR